MLDQHQIRPSMGRRGDCYDNAAAESFFSTLKNELVHDLRFQDRDHARREVVSYIEGFYNRRRLHQSLGYQSPLAFEQTFGCSFFNPSVKPGQLSLSPILSSMFLRLGLDRLVLADYRGVIFKRIRSQADRVAIRNKRPCVMRRHRRSHLGSDLNCRLKLERYRH